jgi:hypothetical protein
MRATKNMFFLFSIAILASCAGNPYETEVSDEYEEEEAFVLQYRRHVDSLFHSIPTYAELTTIKCPSGCFDAMKLDESTPLLIFEPYELSVDSTRSSEFRSTTAASAWSGEWHHYFGWNSVDPENEWTLFELGDRIRETIAARYICVFVQDTARFQLPELDSTASEYTPGQGVGYAVMMDFVTGKVVCAFEVNVTNSEEVNYETYFDTTMIHTNQIAQMDALFAVRQDLYTNIRKEVERQITGSQNRDATLKDEDPIN